jgi:hypothetical protein
MLLFVLFNPAGAINIVKYCMKTIYSLLTLAPAPLFFLGFLYSVLFGHHGGEMALMWFIMMLAHLTPWLLWWQQRNFARN